MVLCSLFELVVECCKVGIVGLLMVNQGCEFDEIESQFFFVVVVVVCYVEVEFGCVCGLLVVNIGLMMLFEEFCVWLVLCWCYGVMIIVILVGDFFVVCVVICDQGLLYFYDVINLCFVEKVVVVGVDGLVVIGVGGGGYLGMFSYFVFIFWLCEMFDGVIVMVGVIGNGVVVCVVELLGVDFVYMGMCFIVIEEVCVVEGYKQMLLEMIVKDIIYMDVIFGINVNFLMFFLIVNGLDLVVVKDLYYKIDMVYELNIEVKVWKIIWFVGQGVGLIYEVLFVVNLIGWLKIEF